MAVWAREGIPHRLTYSFFFSKQEIAQTQRHVWFIRRGEKTLERNIQLSPKVHEDPSANAMVCEPSAGLPPPLLHS